MTELNILSGKHDTFDYTITTMADANIGVIAWSSTEEVPVKLQTVNRNLENSWVLLRKKNTPILLNPSTVDVVDAEPTIALWKRIPVYMLPKSILMGLYSHKVAAFEGIFGVRATVRPRTDLGTDKVVTRPGTFLVDDLVDARISRPLIKALIDAGVFHMPKS